MMTKTLLGVVLFFEVFLAQGGSPYHNPYNYFPSGGDGNYFSGNYHDDVFSGHDPSQIFFPTNTGQEFEPGNQNTQFNQGGQFPSLSAQQPASVDPATSTCGTPPRSCPQTRWRSYDGSCNNLKNPVLGTPQTPYARLLPAIYADGVSAIPRAKSGRDLPLPRTISLDLFHDRPSEDPKFSLASMQYGQIITHDMSLAARTTPSPSCCTRDGQLTQAGATRFQNCYPVVLPRDDEQTLNNNIQCMSFNRSGTDRDRNCGGRFQAAETLTTVNHFLDLSFIYGNTDRGNQQVREFQGGRLKAAHRNGREWLSQNLTGTATCVNVQSLDEPCYLAGDIRVNQNPQLTLHYVLLLREHNRLANILAQLNPHWNDERIFQEARRINIAEHQHITYYEWLPIFLGRQNSLKNRIMYDTKGFTNDYDENVNPSTINEHATVAFRYFHSLIVGRLDLVTENRHSFGSLRMRDHFNRPIVLEQADNFDDLIRGMTWQPTRIASQFIDREITQFLYKSVNGTYGQDLRSIDIQRSRDHGLASYNDFRAFCGLSRAKSFEDFLDQMSRENVHKLTKLYECPDDVDLTVGGSLERLVPGTWAGPVFLCILTEQFYRTRAGDRFFFENGRGAGFTLAQLNEIRKTTISRLFCDNGNNIQNMQRKGFERPNQDNAVVPCENLPALDLHLWQEHGGAGSGQSNHNYFGGSEYFLKKK